MLFCAFGAIRYGTGQNVRADSSWKSSEATKCTRNLVIKSAFLHFNRCRINAVFKHFLSFIFQLTSRIDEFLVNDQNIEEIGRPKSRYDHLKTPGYTKVVQENDTAIIAMTPGCTTTTYHRTQSSSNKNITTTTNTKIELIKFLSSTLDRNLRNLNLSIHSHNL